MFLVTLPLHPLQGVRFLAEEALAEAVRCYRGCRELCIDLMADLCDNDNCNDEKSQVPPNIHGNAADCGGAASSSSTAATAARGSLVRAEYNLGMALVEQKMFRDATPHLSAVGEGFKKMVNEGSAATGPGTEEGRSTPDIAEPFFSPSVWKAALTVHPEGISDLGGLYASSLALLGECFASSSPFCSSPSSLAEVGGIAAVHREEDTAAAAHSTSLPLGMSVNPRGDRLVTAVGTLQASVEAFLSVEDPAGAVDALERLVRILRLFKGREERYLVRATNLCDRVSSAAAPRSTSGGHGCDADGSAGEGEPHNNDNDDLELEIDQVREKIKALHIRLGGSGGGLAGCGQDMASRRWLEVGGRRGGGAGGECFSSEVIERSSQQEPLDGTKHVTNAPPGNARTCKVTAGGFQHRVGPLPTAGFAQRRRRLRTTTSAPTTYGTGRHKSEADEEGGLLNVSTLPRTSTTRQKRPLPDTDAQGEDNYRLSATSGTSGVTASGTAAGEALMLGGGGGLGGQMLGSFSRVRAAAVAAADEAALNVELIAVANGGDVGEGRRGVRVGRREGERTAFAAYRETVRWEPLQENNDFSRRSGIDSGEQKQFSDTLFELFAGVIAW